LLATFIIRRSTSRQTASTAALDGFFRDAEAEVRHGHNTPFTEGFNVRETNAFRALAEDQNLAVELLRREASNELITCGSERDIVTGEMLTIVVLAYPKAQEVLEAADRLVQGGYRGGCSRFAVAAQFLIARHKAERTRNTLKVIAADPRGWLYFRMAIGVCLKRPPDLGCLSEIRDTLTSLREKAPDSKVREAMDFDLTTVTNALK
jgi:hypothetical protein